jgi:hypothetical protein
MMTSDRLIAVLQSDRLLSVLYGSLVALAAISLIISYPKVGMSAIAVSIVSFFLGFATKAGYLRVQGQRVRVPIVERSRVTFSLMVVVMLSLSLVSSFQVQRAIDGAEDCNRQFRNALTYNATVNREDRSLTDDKESALTARRTALDDLIASLGPDRIASAEAVQGYNATARDVERRLSQINDRQMQLQATRAQYPDPTCGRD